MGDGATKTESAAGNKSEAKTIIVTSFGNVLEWYDFALYGYFAPVIANQFFPSDNPITSLIATFSVFAAGYIMRILGGYLFGRMSDRAGRVKALQVSIVLMAVPTTLMAFLPTYAAVGLLAPILLTTLRCLQGLSVGGEFATSVTMLVEKAKPERRGLVGSWAGVAGTLGFLLGAGVAALTSTLTTPAQLDSWAWRIPFLFGSIVGLTGSLLRRGLAESPEYLAEQKKQQEARQEARQAARRKDGSDGRNKAPEVAENEQQTDKELEAKPPSLKEAWHGNKKQLVLTFAGTCLYMVGFYVPFVYAATFVDTETPVSIDMSLRINTLGLLILTAATPIFGHISDKCGRRKTLLWGCAGMAVVSLPLFVMFEQGTVPLDLLAMIIFAMAFAVQQGVAPVFLTEQLPVRIRGIGFGTSFNLAAAFFGGLSPLIATILIAVTHVNIAPSLLIIAAAGISATAFYLCKPVRELYPKDENGNLTVA